jgi:hypothetical protein
LGVVEVIPVAHVALIAGAWVFELVLQIPDALGFAVLVYALFAVGRVISEGARTALALWTGGEVVEARLAPLLQVRLSEGAGARWTVSTAGIVARVAFGLGVVVIASAMGSTWAPARQETVTLVGWLYVEGGLLSLLPLRNDAFDGAVLWDRTWTVRSSWLPYAVVVAFGLACAGLTAIQYPNGYIRAWLVELGQPMPLLVVSLWVATGIVVMSRMNLLGSGQSARPSGTADKSLAGPRFKGP